MTTIETNSFRAWFLASRPKTLTGAVSPVLLALSLTWHHIAVSHAAEGLHFQWIPAVLCCLFAICMQINANFINDYFDCLKGVDNEDRLGPARACSQGWITLPAMKTGIIITTILSVAVGLPTIYWGGWQLIVIGLLCIVFAFLYTTTFSRLGLGDVLVILFFGLTPVCATFYIMTGTITQQVVLLSLAMGLITDTLLLVNNYRDRDTDRAVNKRTLVVLIGTRATEWLYLLIGIISVAVSFVVIRESSDSNSIHLLHLFIPLHLWTWHRMVSIKKGKELNAVLGMTARNIFLFALIVCATLLF